MPPATTSTTTSANPWAILVQCVAIGVVWGATNPFVRRGTIAVEQKQNALKRRRQAQRTATTIAARILPESVTLALTTPQFLLPQLLNQSGGVVFSALLATGAAPLSVAVPVVNAAALAANALADVLLGERYSLPLLVPGVGLVIAGLVLCST
jgi:hypothetical protein